MQTAHPGVIRRQSMSAEGMAALAEVMDKEYDAKKGKRVHCSQVVAIFFGLVMALCFGICATPITIFYIFGRDYVLMSSHTVVMAMINMITEFLAKAFCPAASDAIGRKFFYVTSTVFTWGSMAFTYFTVIAQHDELGNQLDGYDPGMMIFSLYVAAFVKGYSSCSGPIFALISIEACDPKDKTMFTKRYSDFGGIYGIGFACGCILALACILTASDPFKGLMTCLWAAIINGLINSIWKMFTYPETLPMKTPFKCAAAWKDAVKDPTMVWKSTPATWITGLQTLWYGCTISGMGYSFNIMWFYKLGWKSNVEYIFGLFYIGLGVSVANTCWVRGCTMCNKLSLPAIITLTYVIGTIYCLLMAYLGTSTTEGTMFTLWLLFALPCYAYYGTGVACRALWSKQMGFELQSMAQAFYSQANTFGGFGGLIAAAIYAGVLPTGSLPEGSGSNDPNVGLGFWVTMLFPLTGVIHSCIIQSKYKAGIVSDHFDKKTMSTGTVAMG